MDRVADTLVACLARDHGGTVDAALVLSAVHRRASRACRRAAPRCESIAGGTGSGITRAMPRALAGDYDVFHVVDHSYSQLVHRLPAARTVVTCHDLDTFRSILDPRSEPRPALFRAMTRHILAGLQRAARVTCDTAAVRDELVARGLVPAERIVVAPIGVSREFSPDADRGRRSRSRAPARPRNAQGDTKCCTSEARSPRKRIDTLLRRSPRCAARCPTCDSFASAGRSPPSSSGWLGGRSASLSTSRCCRHSTIGCSRPSIAARRSWCCRPRGKDSACRSSKRWRRHAGRRERSAGPARSRRRRCGALRAGRRRRVGARRDGAPSRTIGRPPSDGHDRRRRVGRGRSVGGVCRRGAALRTESMAAAPYSGTRSLHAPPEGRSRREVLSAGPAAAWKPCVGDLCDGTAGEWDVRVVAANEGRHTSASAAATSTSSARGHAGDARIQCRSVRRIPLQLWRERADCVVLHEPNPVAGTVAVSAHARAAPGRLAPRRSAAAVVGAAHLRPRAARPVPTRRLRDRVEPGARRRLRARRLTRGASP